MNQEFYFLRYDYDGNYAKAINRSSDEEITICEECNGRRIILKSNLKIEFKGKKRGDYYWVPEHFIISKKMYNILKENNISGFILKDINIIQEPKLNKSSFNKEELKELVITGKCGYLRRLDGKLFRRCSKCNKVIEDFSGIVGVKINNEDWDGSDICYIENFWGIPVVTQKVKELLEKNKIKNVKFINIKDIELM